MNKKPKTPYHGWLAIDKPEGMTSAQVVGALKRILRPTKIGHAGTLDPMATGCLPIALGEATKTSAFAMDKEKDYTFTLQFGTTTTTDDREGDVVETSDIRPTKEDIEAILPHFTGTITQTPPAYAAIKIDGERAYKKARRGEEVEMPSRKVEIHSLILESFDGESATLSVTCGKGTYVRSLGRDIAESLGSKGHLSMLRRTRVGKFDEKSLISLDFLEKNVYDTPSDLNPSWLLPIDTVLDDILVVEVTEAQADALKHGMPIEREAEEALVRVKCNDILIAIGEHDQGLIKPKRNFNL